MGPIQRAKVPLPCTIRTQRAPRSAARRRGAQGVAHAHSARYILHFAAHVGSLREQIPRRVFREQNSACSATICGTRTRLWESDSTKGFDCEKYARRIDLFARNAERADADIIAIQEVRHDSELESDEGEHQLKHLLARIKNSTEYQFVYQPAMGYAPRRMLEERIEEGMAILSKYPIEASGYALLSRHRGNPADENQRACLHATIRVPSIGRVDVFTTHFSLDKESRRRSAIDVLALADRVRARTGAAHQIIAGDLNAEPTDAAIRILQGLVPVDGGDQTSNFRDVWLDLREEPLRALRSAATSQMRSHFPQTSQKSASTTFSVDRTLPRSFELIPTAVHLVGQDDADNASAQERYPLARPKHGMEHPNAKIWASDHRGVLAFFSLQKGMRKDVAVDISSCRATTYANANFTGRLGEYFHGGYACPDGGFDGNDEARSVVVDGEEETCRAALFEHGNFTGAVVVLGPGKHSLVGTDMEEEASSIIVHAADAELRYPTLAASAAAMRKESEQCLEETTATYS